MSKMADFVRRALRYVTPSAETLRGARQSALGLLLGLIVATPLYVLATSWTAPRTYTTGELMTASILNTHVRDNLLHLKEQSDLHSSILDVDTTAVGNVGTGEDDLITYLVPGGTLGTNGWAVRYEAMGTAVNATTWSTLAIKAYWGTSNATVVSTGALGVTGAWWSATITVVRTGATTQEVWVEGKFYRDDGAAFLSPILAANSGARRLAATETLSGDVTVKLTGELTGTVANNDVSQKWARTFLDRAP